MIGKRKEIIIADLRSSCSYRGISTGHFIPVARMYNELFSEKCTVKIAGGPVYGKYFDIKDRINLPFNVCGDSMLHKIQVFWNSIILFKNAKDSIIIFQQSADVSTHLALALFFWGRAKVYLIRYSNAGINSPIKRFLFSLCKNKIYGVICPNKEVGVAYTRPYIVVPDYIYLKKDEDTDKDNNASKKLFDFCVVGRIADEKGVIEVAKWVSNRSYRIIIAGKTQTQQLYQELTDICKGKDNITLKLGYLPDDEYQYILNNSSFALMNYQGEYSVRSSGVVYDTLFAGLPVIGKRCSALNFIEDNKIGLLYNHISELNDYTVKQLLKESYRATLLSNIKQFRLTHIFHKKQLQSFVLK